MSFPIGVKCLLALANEIRRFGGQLDNGGPWSLSRLQTNADH